MRLFLRVIFCSFSFENLKPEDFTYQIPIPVQPPGSTSIDIAALDYYKIASPSNVSYKDGRVLTDINKLPNPMDIKKIYFPKINNGSLHLREITARRARMLLYENVIGQLSPSQMLCHNSIPIFPLPTENHVIQIAKQVSELVTESAYILEGHPREIVSWMIEQN